MNINIESVDYPSEITVPCAPLSQNLEYLAEVALHQNFNEMKARMLNLAEAMAPETRQCNAVKGLMKDFINKAYYTSVRMVTDEIRRVAGDSKCATGPIMGLNANSMDDILVPERS